MNVDQKLAVIISGIVCFLTTTVRATPVTAATFNFSYSGTSVLDPKDTVTASGVFTTNAYDPTTTSYQITNITGTRNGVQIDSLLSPNTVLDNDNFLFANSQKLDEYGFAYTAGGLSYNVFHSYDDIEISSVGSNYTGYPLSSFSVTPIPEPSSLLGILGITIFTGGIALKRSLRISNKSKRAIVKHLVNYSNPR